MRQVPISTIEERWKDLSLPIERFQELCRLGNFVGVCEWKHFLALAASDLCKVSDFKAGNNVNPTSRNESGNSHENRENV